MLSGPPSGQGAGGGARIRDRRVPADLRADSLVTVPPTPRSLVRATRADNNAVFGKLWNDNTFSPAVAYRQSEHVTATVWRCGGAAYGMAFSTRIKQ
ncbi:hypothetical protein PoB_001572500 [Plakobranchus ocellatus]|uniref:Uncharacterized protein n=1 Tax=Plakobranchus ocellatus TaxID=259542 RepID=A0AAV3Z245_9GAST|nr:hypothetical protein PoB_001572500 [Plakobranchus ocellatus]